MVEVKAVGSPPTAKPPDALFGFVFDKTKRKMFSQGYENNQ